MNLADNQTIPVYSRWIGSWQLSVQRRPLATAQLASQYNRVAPRWSRLTERLGYPASYLRLFEQIISQVDLRRTIRPLRVLDCGVGTGVFSIAFSKAWAAPVCMAAIDVSNSMLERARRQLPQFGLDATLVQADVCSLPYGDRKFDVVLAAHVLEHLPSPVIALKEIQRVLKPGGWMVACLTRNSLLGRYVQLKWRTHRATNESSEFWLRAADLECHPPRFALSGCLRLTSLVSIGRKPYLQFKSSKES